MQWGFYRRLKDGFEGLFMTVHDNNKEFVTDTKSMVERYGRWRRKSGVG